MEPDEPIVTNDEITTDANFAPEDFSDLPADSGAAVENVELPSEFAVGVDSAEAIWDGEAAKSGDEPGLVSEAPSSTESEPASVSDAFEETTVDTNEAVSSDMPSPASTVTDASDNFASLGADLTYEQALAEIDRLAQSQSEDLANKQTDGQPDATTQADPYSAPPLTYEQAMAEIERIAQQPEPASEGAMADNISFAQSDVEPSDSRTSPVAENEEDPTVSSASNASSSTSTEEPAEEPAATTDAAGYATHLHDLSSDDLLNEASHQDQPALREAAFNELKARLHAHDTAPVREQPAADAVALDHPASQADTPADEPPVHSEPEPHAEVLSRADLNAMLSNKAEDADEHLSWKTSVVDLLKLVGKDSSHEARERYAIELGFPEDQIDSTSSAQLNTWLHQHLMTTLAQNGGNLPSNLA
jgi:hypothetical protein